MYIVLGVDLEGHRDVLGHWVGDGAEGANFWLSVISDLQARGVKDILIACMDGLTGFEEAIQAVFPKTEIQRCVIHQIRNSLKYISWKDRKAFMADLRPNMIACILLADHFGVNPNEFLQLAGWPALKVFDIQVTSAENLPPEAVDVAKDIARISDPGTRKMVTEAIRALLTRYFE